MMFGQVEAISKSGTNRSGHVLWVCRCSCGRTFESSGVSLRAGKRVSCDECTSARRRDLATKHGLCGEPEFWILEGMKARCHNPKNKRFDRYGGRGISVCERWLESPANFVADMGKRPSQNHSIERIDRDGNYEPGNCVWATVAEQANNRSNNTRIEIDGRTQNITQWASECGVNRTVILRRMKRGLVGAQLIRKGCQA